METMKILTLPTKGYHPSQGVGILQAIIQSVLLTSNSNSSLIQSVFDQMSNPLEMFEMISPVSNHIKMRKIECR